uniref:Tetraspanin 37 n=1 Tax=Sinocyclocheilus grahami TaxID=75366 RepID=A0A672Q878_SINGR
ITMLALTRRGFRIFIKIASLQIIEWTVVFIFVYFLSFSLCIFSLLLYFTEMLDVDLSPLKDVFQNYSGNSQDPDTKAVNIVSLFCYSCSVKNYTDWLETPWFIHSGKYEVPLSCCNKNFHSCNGTLDSPQGCQIKLEENLLLASCCVLFYSSNYF